MHNNPPKDSLKKIFFFDFLCHPKVHSVHNVCTGKIRHMNINCVFEDTGSKNGTRL